MKIGTQGHPHLIFVFSTYSGVIYTEWTCLWCSIIIPLSFVEHYLHSRLTAAATLPALAIQRIPVPEISNTVMRINRVFINRSSIWNESQDLFVGWFADSTGGVDFEFSSIKFLSPDVSLL